MFRRPSPRLAARSTPRRGAILLVVLTMLALFAVIGLGFVLYAESEANAARIAKDAANADLKPIDATDAINGFLGQMIYPQDTPDSALYGHDLARLMYGRPGNTSPYNGVGVYDEQLNMATIGLPIISGTVPPLHRSQVVRYGKYVPNPLDATKFVTIFPDQTYADPTWDYGTVTDFTKLKYVGRNAPYTYPDRNNIYLAVQDPATGRVVKPSYHAPSLFRASYAANPTTFFHLEAANPNWYTPQGHFQLLRPRTVDHLTVAEMTYLGTQSLWPIPAVITVGQAQNLFTILSGNSTDPAAPASFKKAFPFPAPNPDGTLTGDVQNVKYGEGRQTADSVWIDAKLPLVNFRGRKLQPLIAATVLALDGRVNYNVAGNLAAAGSKHGSNQGFTPAEVSLFRILQAVDTDATPLAVQKLVRERYGNALTVPNPSGSSRTVAYFHEGSDAPTSAGRATSPPSYSHVDYNGDGGGPAPSLPTNSFRTSYDFSAATAYATNQVAEGTQPPALLNPYQWNPLTITGAATAGSGSQFPLADARWLNARYSEKSKYAVNATNVGTFQVRATPATQYAASSPQHPMNRARALLTPESNRLSRPGLPPMAIGNLVGSANNAGAPALVLLPGASAPILADPAAATVAVVGPKFDLSPNQPYTLAAPTGNAAVGGDITGSLTTQASNLRAFLQGVDLNRPLADYRDLTTQPMVTPATTPPTVDAARDWPFIPGPNPVSPGVMPIAPTTVTPDSSGRASADRQALATDIFQRLCVALNARVFLADRKFLLPQWSASTTRYELTVAPADFASPPAGYTTQTWVVSQPEYDAIRWLAQLSANIVDATDPDDVSTVFQWNSPPTPPAGGPPPTVTAFTPDAPGGLADCVVIGVEKPKLVINEAYAEVANKQADYAKSELMAGDRFTIRFFVELLNPNNVESTGATAAGVKVDQSARNGGRASLQFPASAVPTAYSVYRLKVYDRGITAFNEAATPAGNFNYVLGQPLTATAPRLDANFIGVASDADPAGADLPFYVEPNDGAFRSEHTAAPAALPPVVRGRKGFCVVGPKLDPATTESPATAYAPKTNIATEVANFMLMKTTPAPASLDQLEYECAILPPADPADIKVQVVDELNKTESHTVLLQRLANPYQPENLAPGPQFNPYVTVDVMGGVKINDAIRIGLKKPGGTDGTRPTPAKPDENFALGRVQPHAGYQLLSAPAVPPAPAAPYFQPIAEVGTPPLGVTMAVLQNPQPAPPATESRNTFFRHNSRDNPPPTLPLPLANPAETLLHEFKEPFHPDRKLVNSLEILHLTASPSHLLAYNFARPNGTAMPYNPATPPAFHQGELSRVALPTGAAGAQPSILYRALEVLNVKPWTYGVPHAGRTPGVLNINAMWDQLNKTAGDPATGESTVFQALLDPQPANTFWAANPNEYTVTNTLWRAVRSSRNPNWDMAIDAPMTATMAAALGATVDEWDPTATPPGFGKDRPFKGYGVGQYDTTSGVGIVNTQGLESTLLRSGATPGTPLFANTSQADPYRQLEALRKATNNLTTVSDNFLVVFTVGFFDIDADSFALPTPRIVLRREAYEAVPGDLRSQFTAVLDRTGLATDNPNTNGNAGGSGKFAQAMLANFVRVADGTVGPNKRANYAVTFPATKLNGAIIEVRDNPTANGSVFQVGSGTRLRLGDGPNVNTYSVLNTPAPTFDTNTGLATVTIDTGIVVTSTPTSTGLPTVAGERLPAHAAGELICLPDNELTAATAIFVPGNPGKVTNFTPGGAAFRGVVRYFGQLKP